MKVTTGKRSETLDKKIQILLNCDEFVFYRHLRLRKAHARVLKDKLEAHPHLTRVQPGFVY